ncbi:unannotated protein [freshwater metagenome]|uniref:Unannotated protein n=1 Tax=freshwater metagenome TaxID=449393 RepID=A0A6J6IGV9_9ZZZZ|nr:hypothetical protein [Actinomycetota bacterium]
MTRGFSLRNRLRYRFDNALSKGIWAVLAWLALIAILFVVLVAAILTFLGVGPSDEPTNFLEAIWLTISRSLDAGTFTGDEGGRFRITSLLVTLVGIFLAATIIGLISAGIDNQIESLRRGKSLVAERQHTLIIGRSDELLAIISELIEANMSERGKAIAILTPDDPIEVNEDIRSAISDFKTSKVVVRTGKATRVNDLAQLNPASARSIIVLRGTGESDAHVVKVVLALAQLLPRDSTIPIVVQVDDADTAQALRESIELNVLTVIPREIIARISAQVSRSTGLGVIYQEFLDFQGDEIYFTDVTQNYVGCTYADLLLASSSATIIGIQSQSDGVVLNPSSMRVLIQGDRAIGISEDDSTFILDRPTQTRSASTVTSLEPIVKQQERTLIVGWSDLTPLIADEIESHVAPNSQLHILINGSQHESSEITDAMALVNQSIIVHEGNAISKVDLERVIRSGPFDHILLLSERSDFEAEEADSRTLLSLMQLRGITAGTSNAENITAELMDPSHVDLGGKQSSHDFIVSQQLISLLMAQLSESPQLFDVFNELFNSGGVVVGLHPVERYFEPGTRTFEEVIEACRLCDVTPIGYRAKDALNDPLALNGGIRLNPPKNARIQFQPGDALAVIFNNSPF